MAISRIEAVRKRLGWSQAVLADRLGVTIRTVIRWEQGAEPIPRTLAALKALECISKWSPAARNALIASVQNGDPISPAEQDELCAYGAVDRRGKATFAGVRCVELLRGSDLQIIDTSIQHWRVRRANRIEVHQALSGDAHKLNERELAVVFLRDDEQLYSDHIMSVDELDALAAELEAAGVDTAGLRGHRLWLAATQGKWPTTKRKLLLIVNERLKAEFAAVTGNAEFNVEVSDINPMGNLAFRPAGDVNSPVVEAAKRIVAELRDQYVITSE